MIQIYKLPVCAAAMLALVPSLAAGQIHAMVN